MKKQCVWYLAVLTLFACTAIIPVSAATTTNPNGTVIELGAMVFIGEEHLNLTHALNRATTGFTESQIDQQPGNLTLGWWASAAQITTSAPTKSISLAGTRYRDFTVSPADFVGYTGNWYLLRSDGQSVQTGTGTTPLAAINVQDPTLSMVVWDYTRGTNPAGTPGFAGSDVNGKSIWRGDALGFKIDSNLYTAAQTTLRNNTIWSVNYGAMALPGDHKTNATNGTWEFTSSNAPAAYSGLVSGMAPGVTLVVQHNGTTQLMTYNNVNAPLGAWNYSYWNATGISSTVGSFNTSANGLGDASAIGLWNPGTTNLRTAASVVNVPTSATDGFVTIKVKDESGAIYNKLKVNTTASATPLDKSLTDQFVDTTPWFFGSSQDYWVTGAMGADGQYIYPVGEYTYWAESVLNNMKDNYKNNGADYTGKTVSASGTFKLSTFSLKIEADKDSVVTSKRFIVTITGRPSSFYYVWVKGTSDMDGTYDNQPPLIVPDTESVSRDDDISAGTGTHPIGDYQYENGGGATVYDDVASAPFNRTRYYAKIKTSGSGTRPVEFVTTNNTKAQKYTIHVEAKLDGEYSSDEIDVNVERGVVTVVAAGDKSYYLGEEIKLSGTNTETYKTYLFLVGPNLPTKGAVIFNADPRNALMGSQFSPQKDQKGVINNDATTFQTVDVRGDNTWSWKWGTANYALDAGTYTIYAVSQPYDRENLENAAYGTVSIIIKKPFVSATASQSAVAKGDSIFITGTAEGNPGTVQIWILGKNYADKQSTSVRSDASFEYEIAMDTTQDLASGQYFVIVQHPMQNKVFDVDLSGNYVINRQLLAYGSTATESNYTRIFTLLGAGSLQGSDAAEALAEGINNANVDDTYTKLQFLVEEPAITIDTIGDRHVGDKFTITATTNLAVDDDILVQVYSSSFKPTMKSQSGEFSGAAGTVKVTKGDSGSNRISFNVDSSTFRPDEYIVTEDAVLQTATGTALFNVLETSAGTVAPTVAGTAVQTPAPAGARTPVQTAAQPTATPAKSPGFGVLVALVGLGAVGMGAVRRK